jgi:hypothetical protein
VALLTVRHGDAVVWKDENGLWVGAQGSAFPSLADTVFKPPNGALFWRNDLANFYVWNHTGWELVGAGGGGGVAISAGTESQSTGTVIFSNSNGVTFGLDGGTLTASVAAGGLANIGLSAGTTSNLLSAFTLSNANGVSFGLDGSTVTASVETNYQTPGAYLTTAALSDHSHGASAANGSFAFQTLSFSNANNFSFGTSAGNAITGSYTVPTVTNSSMTVSDAATSGTLARLAFTNLNGVTLSLSTGAGGSHTIVGSHNALTSQSNQAFSADASSTFQTLTFQNSNGVSFSNNAGALRITHALQFTSNTSAITSAALHTSAALRAVYDGANSISTGTIRFTNANGVSFSINGQTLSASVAAQSNQQMTMFATGNTTLSSTGTSNASSLIFRGSGAASVGITNGSVLIDVAAGAAAITQSIGISTQTAGGSTAGTSGYATGDDILYHFVPGSNITMSQSLNGASATLSIYGPAAGGGNTLSGWNPHENAVGVLHAQSNQSLLLQPQIAPFAFQCDRVVMPMHFSQATNSTLTVSNTIYWGFFTKNGVSLSLYASSSGSFSINGSGTASSASNSGIRIVSFGYTTTITPGNYYLGYVWRSSTSGANASLSNMCASQINSSISGYIGSATATNQPIFAGQGVWTSTTSGIPNSLAFTDIRAVSSAFLRPPMFHFTSGTT